MRQLMLLTERGRYANVLVEQVNTLLAKFGRAPATAAAIEQARDDLVSRADAGRLTLHGWLGRQRLETNRALGVYWAIEPHGILDVVRESRLSRYLLLRAETEIACIEWPPTIARILAGRRPHVRLPEDTRLLLLGAAQVIDGRRAELRITPRPARA